MTDIDALYALLERPDWHRRAACRGANPNLFFVERNENATEARHICGTCPVAQQCLLENLHEREGIWGGTNGRQRQAIRRKMEMDPLFVPQAGVSVPRIDRSHGNFPTATNCCDGPHGERCSLCRDAMRAYWRDQKIRAYASNPVARERQLEATRRWKQAHQNTIALKKGA